MTNHLKIGRDISEHATYMEHMLAADRLEDADQLAGLATKELTGGKEKIFDLSYPKEVEHENTWRSYYTNYYGGLIAQARDKYVQPTKQDMKDAPLDDPSSSRAPKRARVEMPPQSKAVQLPFL